MTKFSYTVMDCVFGVILCLAALLGAVMNTFAFIYFKSTKKRNKNGKFFKRLYSFISFNDILICLGVFPAIEASFSSDREGFLFSNSLFCSAWFVFWFTVYYLSMILIAVLSISRLILIKSPKCLLIPWLSYAICGTVCVIIFTFWTTLTAVQLVYTTYYTEHLFCGFATFSNADLTVPYNSGKTAGILLIIINGVSIVCFVTVCTSFILSLVFLNKFSKAARGKGMSRKHQVAAAKTVILMTLLYILFNVPLIMITLYMISDRAVHPVPDDATVGYMIERVYTKLFQEATFLNHYAFAFCFVLATCLNSMMNPIVYSRRISGFKKFLLDLWKNRAPNLSIDTFSSTGTTQQLRGISTPNYKKRSDHLTTITENSM